MKQLYNLIWIGLLIFGLIASAGPVVRRIQRVYSRQVAVLTWRKIRNQPCSGQPHELCAWLRISEAGLSLPVRIGIDKQTLRMAPGYMKIGQASLIVAHRDTHFRKLKNVKPGDRILLELRGGKTSGFRVTDQIIVDAAAAEQSIARLSCRNCLILLTCYPFHYIGPAPFRMILYAEPC